MISAARILVVLIFSMLFMTTVTSAKTNDEVNRENKVRAIIGYGDDIVNYPIDVIKNEKDYAMEKDKYYIINIIEDDNTVKLQVTDEETAIELGYRDDPLGNTNGIDVEFGVIPNNKPVVMLETMGNGIRYKQVISEDKIDEMKEIVNGNNGNETNTYAGEGNHNGISYTDSQPRTGSGHDNKTTLTSKGGNGEGNKNGKNTEGSLLPSTATNLFNVLLIGSFILTVGLILTTRKKGIKE